MKPDHIVLCVFGFLVLAILADQLAYRIKQRVSAVKSKPELAPPADLPADQAAQSSGNFASEESGQFKQSLALSASIRDLEGRFAVLQSQTPEASRCDSVKREFVIIAEQLRIARSYEDELLRHVFSWRGRNGNFSFADTNFASCHRPTYAQAAWAYTAANLTLSFACARLVALGG